MRVLLLGAGGYLGRFVADRLLADPAVQLTALGRGDDADVRFDLSTGSPGALTRFLDAVHPGVVINCAGTTRGNGRELIRHNVVATAAVCEALRRSGCGARLVHVGCAAEYGPSQPGSSTGEDAVPRPGGPYGVSKLAGTELVLASGLDAVVLRVFSPVGPGTPAGSPLGRIAEAMRRAMQQGDGELKLGGLGVQRDFVDVRDVARAVHAASLSAAQGIVNIGTGRAVRLRDAASLLARVAGYAGSVHEQGGGPAPGDGHPGAVAGAHGTGPGGPGAPGGPAGPGGNGGPAGPGGQMPVIPAQVHAGHALQAAHAQQGAHGHHPGQPPAASQHVPHAAPSAQSAPVAPSGPPASYPYPDGCGAWQQADVRTARDRLGWRPRIGMEESLADIWMEAACRI
ncbi:NAD-dependent epimerase/dehydratase family protein [Streptomyces reniochalinae]|uniref:NAD-dependent epimerase/dehydratase family protein n=1 Tax=Streptomyces reniochalinae TaxID=2250578 RepID=A0A367EYG1_9ACTN|nr:NAD-dependent epimerase/dehydratase family protein [Streptomyces reniochalinae]RCG22595.1 NAD-dependent epimerase/dehydratase family protein [Streptomyces reniochalinae]